MPEVPAVPGARALGARVDRIFDPETGALRGALDGFEARSGQRQLARAVADTFDTGGTLLAEAGTSKSKVLSCQVILNNIGDFAAMNSVYDAWIDPANPPARACIEARLAHPSLKVEIIAIAALD